MERRERTFRGVSARAVVGYLVRLGGERIDDRTVQGDGWQATVDSETVPINASLDITETTIRFEGEPAVLDPLIEAFAQKAMRAGG